MRTLADEEIFSPVVEILRSVASMVRSGKRIPLSATDTTLISSLARAPVEAALLDEGIPYSRIIPDGPESKSAGLHSPFILFDPSLDEFSFDSDLSALVIGGDVPTLSLIHI